MSATVHLLGPRLAAGTCRINAPRRGPGRLHALDLDNLHRTGRPSISRIDQVHDAYQSVGIAETDLVFGACNHYPGRTPSERSIVEYHLLTLWSPATVRLATGADGADHALINDITGRLGASQVASRFNDAVIGSGDRIFTFAALRLRKAGLEVHLVISDQQALARDLARVADGCIWHLHDRRCLRHQEPAVVQKMAA